MRDAGITDPKDVHYVQTKTPLLTIEFGARCREPRHRTSPARCTTPWASRTARPRSASPSRSARSRCRKAEQICKDLDLYSSVASCSSGVELTQAQIVLLGNKAGAGGRYRIGHAVMRDALDIDGIYESIRNAGLDLPERPRAEDLKGRVVNCFMKCEADRTRQAARAAADHARRFRRASSPPLQGARSAASRPPRSAIPAVFVSVDAMHQGPQGGGPGDRHRRRGRMTQTRHGPCLLTHVSGTDAPKSSERHDRRQLRGSMMQMTSNRDCWRSFAGIARAVPRRCASAQDKVKVGVFPVSSSLPYFVALEHGYFKELNIEPETIKLMGGPPNVAAMITNQIEVSAVLVTSKASTPTSRSPASRCTSRMQQPERDLPDGAVRGPQGPRRQGEVARGPQGHEADVGAGPGQRQHRQGRARQGRA